MKKNSEFSEKNAFMEPVQSDNVPIPREQGITPTVQTIFSKITVKDIIEFITDIKSYTTLSWLKKKNIHPKNTLIIGTYLTGAKIANQLVKSSKVTVVDIHPHLKYFLDQNILFKNSVFELKPSEKFDLMIDTTGIGGLSFKEIKKLKIENLNNIQAFIAENPTSEGSDSQIVNIDQTSKRLEYIDAPYKGYLFTKGLNSKTSGTMTLTMEVLRNSMENVLKEEGVLYAVSSLDFYERILFQEKDPETYLKSIKKSALIISALKKVNCDPIIQKNLNKIVSTVIEKN